MDKTIKQLIGSRLAEIKDRAKVQHAINVVAVNCLEIPREPLQKAAISNDDDLLCAVVGAWRKLEDEIDSNSSNRSPGMRVAILLEGMVEMVKAARSR